MMEKSSKKKFYKMKFTLFDFALTEDEMEQIAGVDKDIRYYTSTPEILEKYAKWIPPVDEEKSEGLIS